MLIVGTGPIGCELGQSFARLGTEVTMFERGKHFLPRDDPEAVAFLKTQMEHDGVRLVFEASVKEFQ
jgi:pyruvate/2-oxoglutarate dehydrogenase complex dihydrolipoamide dehydrogenase (E3) component